MDYPTPITPSPFVLTFDSLIKFLQVWLQRYDQITADQLPIIIQNAQNRISLAFQNLVFQVYTPSNSVMIVGQQNYQKPLRWRSTAFLTISSPDSTGAYNVRHPLILRDEVCLIQYNPNATVLGMPKYYANRGFNAFTVAPTPDLPYSYELSYFEQSAILSADTETTSMTESMPEVLQSACLLEAQIYVQNFFGTSDPAQMSSYENSFNKTLAAWANINNMALADHMTKIGL